MGLFFNLPKILGGIYVTMLIVFYIRYISLIMIGKKVYNSYEVFILLFSPIYLITEDGRLKIKNILLF